MASAYPIELRERVIAYVKDGGRKSEACRLFKIGHDTIYRWIKLDRENNLYPKSVGGNRRKLDDARFERYVEENHDKIQREIAEEFGIRQAGVCKALKRLKITRKKNQTLYRKGRSKKRRVQGILKKHP